jgi:ribosomal protein L37AE/L43A
LEQKMKSLREWVEENNLNEIFGLFGKPKPQEQAPAVEQPKQQRAFCPFCIAWSGVVDDAYNGRMVWHCTKCKRDWDKAAVDRAHSDKIRSGDYDLHPGALGEGPFLPKTNFSGGPDGGGVRESLYLAGLIGGDMYYEEIQQPNDDHLVRTMASSLHDDWRKGRLTSGTHGQADAVYEPRVKPSGLDDGQDVDIAQHYDKLTPKWQAENKAAASAAISLVRQAVASGSSLQQLSSGSGMEVLADKVHQAWMQRNPKADYNAAQHVPYASLPEDEKQKDRNHVLMAIKLLSN